MSNQEYHVETGRYKKVVVNDKFNRVMILSDPEAGLLNHSIRFTDDRFGDVVNNRIDVSDSCLKNFYKALQLHFGEEIKE